MDKENRRKLLNEDDTTQEATNGTHKENAQIGNQQTLAHKYVFYSLGEFLADLTPMEYLIDNWIQAEGLHQIFGESGSYKSFNVIDMCGRIACNDFETWCGKSVEHGGVVYLAGEGIKGLQKRLAGWCLEYGKNPNDIPFHISPEPFTLDDKTPEHCIETTIGNIRAVCPNVKLVVVDTLNRYMSGEENSATDMGAFVLACSKLQRGLGCAVLIVHHSGLAQDAKGRGRGSGALYAALDIEIKCEKTGMTCKLTQTKNKEAKKDNPVSFDMKEIEIPGVKDKKGNPVRMTTLVPIFNQSQTDAQATAETGTQGKNEFPNSVKFALKTYGIAAKLHGEIFTDNPDTDHETIRLDVEKWRNIFYKESTADNDNTKRQAFSRARKDTAEQLEIFTHYSEGGIEYYCLDLSDTKTKTAYRFDIHTAIKNREKAEAEKSAKANDAGAADADGGKTETNRTANLL